eukprot:765088_1
MAELRKSKKHQLFEQKYHRDSARMIKKLQLQSNESQSESPPPPPSSSSKSITKKRKHNELNDDNTPIVFTEEEINANFPTSFGKKKALNKSNKACTNNTKKK